MRWLAKDGNETDSPKWRIDWALAGTALVVLGIAALVVAAGSFRPAPATASTSGAEGVARPAAAVPGGGQLPGQRGPALRPRRGARLPGPGASGRAGPLPAPGPGALAGSPLATSALRHAEEIGLTEDQRQRIDAADREARRAHIERRAARDMARLELGGLLEGDAALDTVETKLHELAGLQVDERLARLRLQREIEAILTTEQVDELQGLRRDRLERAREGRGPGRAREGLRHRPGPTPR